MMKSLSESILSSDFDVEVLSLEEIANRVFNNKLTEREVIKLLNTSLDQANPSDDARKQFITVTPFKSQNGSWGIKIFWDDNYMKGSRSNTAYEINISYKNSGSSAVSYWINDKNSYKIDYNVDDRWFLEKLARRNFRML